MEATASIFNIERFATEDGPGIRTVVFLKGCGLRCKWCANPESQSFSPEIMFNANICVGCGRCAAICPQQAIRNLPPFGFITDAKLCNLCKTCISGCYQGARSVMGTTYTVSQLLEILLRDAPYYEMSGGGVTFSGGEPLMQEPFLAAVAQELHQRDIPILVETCGHVPKENVMRAAAYADAIFYDIKHIDPVQHKALTGSDNRIILENLQWLAENFRGRIAVRYPYIPTCNDKKEDIEAFLAYIKEQKTIKEVWFLPYHRLGIPKYQGLGRIYEMGDRESLKMKDIAFLKNYQPDYPFEIKI